MYSIAPIDTPFVNFLFGYGISVGDYDGDSSQDLLISRNFTGFPNDRGEIHFYKGGQSFDLLPDRIFKRPGGFSDGSEWFGRIVEHLGDFNGDGFDDFFAGSTYADTLGYIYFGGPALDSIPDIITSERYREAALAGDVNRDGYPDLLTTFHLSIPGTGHFNIYFGGPDCDSIPDIQVNSFEMPGLLHDFGMDCRGVGDFDGDGTDDYAISANNSLSRGIVYIFAGEALGTDVEIDYEPVLPESIELGQNFPNPFNPQTTIRFSLPVRSEIELTIHNLLGQNIRTLAKRSLSAGEHQLFWDGTDNNGEQVASGMYFYKLKSADRILSRKMLLLK